MGDEEAKARFMSISGRMVLLREVVRVFSVSSRHWQRVMSKEHRLQEVVVIVVTCSMHAHLLVDEHVPQPRGWGLTPEELVLLAGGRLCCVVLGGFRLRLGGRATASVPVDLAPLRRYAISTFKASASLLRLSSISSARIALDWYCCESSAARLKSASIFVICALASSSSAFIKASRFSLSSSVSFSCSSSSPTLAALLSLKARCAARFCAFLFVGGVSVAGFLPGFGLGGITHSFLGPNVIGLAISPPGVPGCDAIIICWLFGIGLIASIGGAGAMFAGEPTDDGVLAAE